MLSTRENETLCTIVQHNIWTCAVALEQMPKNSASLFVGQVEKCLVRLHVVTRCSQMRYIIHSSKSCQQTRSPSSQQRVRVRQHFDVTRQKACGSVVYKSAIKSNISSYNMNFHPCCIYNCINQVAKKTFWKWP